jgi:hypothetical protein
LVARSETGQLAILELKNQEDRYVVQQLTRYFDAFLAERPFAEQMDYGQPIRLLAIAPTFHRDNFTDRKYSRISIEFLTFQLQPDQGGVSLTLSHLDTGGRTATHAPEQVAPSQPAVASPPKALFSLSFTLIVIASEAMFDRRPTRRFSPPSATLKFRPADERNHQRQQCAVWQWQK